MEKHIEKIEIKNFKKLNNIIVSDIGQFNLIVGNNDVGKTTFLEALVFNDENPIQFLKNIHVALQQNRKIFIRDGVRNNYLDFYYYDYSISKKITLEIDLTNKKHISITLEKRKMSDLSDNELDTLKAKLITHRGTNHFVEFQINGITTLEPVTFGLEPDKFTNYSPFISYGLSYQTDLVTLFSETTESLSNLKNLIIAIQRFYPTIENIEISLNPNFSAQLNEAPILVVRLKGEDVARPLSLFGDGINKFFRYLLEIEKCENNRLMIDEIDTGIHYSKMTDFFKNIITASINKKVQLFATTHSKECIESFKAALEETGMQSEGRIIHLADTKKGIKAYTMKFEEFENALLAESEIR